MIAGLRMSRSTVSGNGSPPARPVQIQPLKEVLLQPLALRFGAVQPFVAQKTETLDAHRTIAYANQINSDGPRVSITFSNGSVEPGSAEWGPWNVFTRMPPDGKWPGKVLISKNTKVHSYTIDLRQHPDFIGWEKRVYTDWKPIACDQYREPVLAETPWMKLKMRFSPAYRQHITDLRQEILNGITQSGRERVIKIANEMLAIQRLLHPSRKQKPFWVIGER